MLEVAKGTSRELTPHTLLYIPAFATLGHRFLPSHLLRTFRRHHGMTIASYARQRRIERAGAELATTTRSLSMIALDAGVADQSHFTEVFEQTSGETPGEYVRSLCRS